MKFLRKKLRLVAENYVAKPTIMKLRLVAQPSNHFALMCAISVSKGWDGLRLQFPGLDHHMTKRIARALDRSGARGMLEDFTYHIYPAGQVTDANGAVVGMIG